MIQYAAGNLGFGWYVSFMGSALIVFVTRTTTTYILCYLCNCRSFCLFFLQLVRGSGIATNIHSRTATARSRTSLVLSGGGYFGYLMCRDMALRWHRILPMAFRSGWHDQLLLTWVNVTNISRGII